MKIMIPLRNVPGVTTLPPLSGHRLPIKELQDFAKAYEDELVALDFDLRNTATDKRMALAAQRKRVAHILKQVRAILASAKKTPATITEKLASDVALNDMYLRFVSENTSSQPASKPVNEYERACYTSKLAA